MQAVKLDSYQMILFSRGPIPERIRPEIVEGLGGVIREGVTLVIPPDAYDWPDGSNAPDALLCVSRSDPVHYEVIKFRDQAATRDFDILDRTYGVIDSDSAWDTFLESLKALNAIADGAVGVEPPDTPGADESS